MSRNIYTVVCPGREGQRSGDYYSSHSVPPVVNRLVASLSLALATGCFSLLLLLVCGGKKCIVGLLMCLRKNHLQDFACAQFSNYSALFFINKLLFRIILTFYNCLKSHFVIAAVKQYYVLFLLLLLIFTSNNNILRYSYYL